MTREDAAQVKGAWERLDRPSRRALLRMAREGWRGKLARLGAMGAIVVATLAVAGALADAAKLGRPGRVAREWPVALGAGVLVVLGVGGAWAVRCWMVRRRARRMLAGRGACPGCGYGLAGAPLNGAMEARCPECAAVVKADEQIGEVGRSARGAAVFEPVLPRPGLSGVRRRRVARRVIGYGSLAAVLLAAGSYGVWTLLLVRQAGRAEGARDGAERIRELIASAQPVPGSGADGGGDLAARNEWARVNEILDGVDRFERAFLESRAPGSTLGGRPEAIDYTLLFPKSARAPRRGRAPEPADTERTKAGIALADAALAEMRRRGFLDSLEPLRAVGVAMRPVPGTRPGPDGSPPPLVEWLVPGLRQVRQTARLNGARMVRAAEAGDAAEYVAALDQTLALARICDAQGTLIERLTGTAVESLALHRVMRDLPRITDAEWVARIGATIDARARREGMSRAIECERLMAVDTVRWVFADPWRAQRAAVLGEVRLRDGVLIAGWSPLEESLGWMDENVAALSGPSAAHRRTAEAEPWARAPGPVPGAGGLALPAALGPAFQKAQMSEDQLLAQHRGTRVLVGVRHYELRTGRAPGSLAELGPEDLPRPPVDPYSGRPFGYARVDAATDRAGRRYLVYSAGLGGVDNGGSDGGLAWYDAIRAGGTADYVVNEPLE